MSEVAAYALVNAALNAFGRFDAASLAPMTERHHVALPNVPLRHSGSLVEDLGREPVAGVIITLEFGIPNRRQRDLLGQILAQGKRAFLYWPVESAIEVVDGEKLRALRLHGLAFAIGVRIKSWTERRRAAVGAPAAAPQGDVAVVQDMIAHLGREAQSLDEHLAGGVVQLRSSVTSNVDHVLSHARAVEVQLEAARDALAGVSSPAASAVRDGLVALGGVKSAAEGVHHIGGIADYLESGFPVLQRIREQSAAAAASVAIIAATPAAATSAGEAGPYTDRDLPGVAAFLRSIAEDARPVPLPDVSRVSSSRRIAGTGMYLRLDFWAPITSGGSYGHSCYQGQALAETTSDFVAVMANRFDLLDELGVRQTTVPTRDMTQTEANILGMNRHYMERLGPLFSAIKPAYIFERIVLGSGVGAWASRKYGIPYIIEYNGSEISMKRSFAGEGYAHEDLLLLAEDAAFRQATIISVVSDHVAADVARRGVPESRILVNPNAVDLDAYKPAAPAERATLRQALGFRDEHRVVGFIGTFGGWHGIDVLAAALPKVAAADPSIRFLLIGDGNLKHLVVDCVAQHGLQDRVVDVGRVPQAKGAELLKACDILVSPHSRNMVDSPFFGSPTKLFEYMAMGVGIVASDLEQIAHVMTPALRVADLASPGKRSGVGKARGVLCPPGDVEEFTAAVTALARAPAIASALGKNARDAADKYYTWRQHVRNLWLHAAGKPAEGYAIDRVKG